MKFRNYLLLLLLLVSIGMFGANITLKMFGAKGDGKADDTKAFKSALLYAQKNSENVNGEGLTYFLSGNLELMLSHFSLSNCNFITSKNFENQFSLKVSSDNVLMDNISFDGGRNTYKNEIESWKDFSQENGIVSIYPTTDDLFYFVGLSKDAKMSFQNIQMKNIHASSCLTVITYGLVLLDNLYFQNISNKTYHVYHSIDEGEYQSGKTIVGSVLSDDVGIFPIIIKYKEKDVSSKDINVMPQASFNFIVSFGEYHLKSAIVKNYGSTGVTSDRNRLFQADYISIKNDSDKTFSNNPSGGMWFEGTSNINVKRIDIDIENRDDRDLLFDSSAFHIYGIDTVGTIDSLNIKGKKLNKGLRGSFEGNNNLIFNNIVIEGDYKQAAGLLSMMPGSKIESQISIGNLILNKGVVEFYGMKGVSIINAKGLSGFESINFKLPYSIKTKENYFIKTTNIKNVYKNNLIKNIKVFDSKNIKLNIKNLQ